MGEAQNFMSAGMIMREIVNAIAPRSFPTAMRKENFEEDGRIVGFGKANSAAVDDQWKGTIRDKPVIVKIKEAWLAHAHSFLNLRPGWARQTCLLLHAFLDCFE